ncbi:MAG: AMP-binding protein, partial [Bacteroidales bacterium]|nr:AMP-binding protein [Bacteroidales bacterium]
MIEKYLEKTAFADMDDFRKNFRLRVPEDFNFAYDVMDAWAEEAPDKLALLWTSEEGACRRFSFRDLKIMSDRAASYFQTLGIGKGDMVMIILGRRYEFWVTMLALHKIGAVAIPATHLLTARDIIYRIWKAGVKSVSCAGERYILDNVKAAYDKCGGESSSVTSLVSVGPEFPKGFHDFHREWMGAPEFHRPEDRGTNDDIQLVYFTSGTSGEPKMVVHDRTYALGHLATGVFWHNLGPDSIHLTIADTGWGKAVWGKFYGQWFAGATVFVYDHERFKADDILRLIGRYRITSLCAPPTILRFLIQEDLGKYDLSSLKYLCTAGEALNGSVYDTMLEKTGLKIHEGFGQTETTLTLGTFPWMEPKPGSMGVPSPQYDVVLLKEDGTEAGEGEIGEICVRTSAGKPCGLFKGYHGEPERTARIWHDGFYHSSDLAWKDQDGYFWFVGRNDDIIKTSGYRVSPFEVESVLMAHPAVVECAVTGVPDPLRGYLVKATVVLASSYRSQAGPELAK